MVTWDRYLRAPWMFDKCPLRFRVQRASYATVPIWVATPINTGSDWPMAYVGDTGSRAIYLPRLSVVAATWREAMNYVSDGRPPRPLSQVYPRYCGVLADHRDGTAIGAINARRGVR